MRLGGDTVSVVSVTENAAVRDRYNNPEPVESAIPVPNCRFRPMTAKERTDLDMVRKSSTDLGDRIHDPWKLTAPPVGAILNLTAGDKVRYNGVDYEVFGGVRVFTDFSGRNYKCTVVCERYLG